MFITSLLCSRLSASAEGISVNKTDKSLGGTRGGEVEDKRGITLQQVFTIG